MFLGKRLIAVFIIGLIPAGLLHAQPNVKTFDFSSFLAGPTLGPGCDHRQILETFITDGNERDRQLKVLVAQTSQPGDQKTEPTRKVMDEIKERLEARIRALEAEWAALKEEEEEINRIGRGGTLRGSNTKKFMKRTEDFNQRVMKYNAEKKRLREDIEAYENAVKNASMGPIDAGPEDPAEKTAQTKAYLEKKREELAEEYRALKQEKQQIGGPAETGASTNNLPTVNQQISLWNEKMKEFAKKRKVFNESVRAFNEKTGENVQPLPEP